MTSEHPQPDRRLASRKQAVLEEAFPGWRIRHLRGMWTASRETPAQAAGLYQYIIRPCPKALAAVLGEQELLARWAVRAA